jgi:hypothetical protein
MTAKFKAWFFHLRDKLQPKNGGFMGDQNDDLEG